jgi:hypothetical protein
MAEIGRSHRQGHAYKVVSGPCPKPRSPGVAATRGCGPRSCQVAEDVDDVVQDPSFPTRATGRVRPVIDRCYRLEEIVDAHTYVGEGHKVGGVPITI